MNPDALIRNLHTRSRVIQAVRDFFITGGYLEVDTPIRCPSVIPEAHIDPVSSEGNFLQASPELCMKRLLSRGMDRIFQICKCFRKNERGKRHLPELTLLEWYTRDASYWDLMDQCENLIRHIARALNLNSEIHYQGKTIDLESSWHKLTVKEAFQRHSDTSLETALKTDVFDEIVSFQIEPYLGIDHPAFLHDYPSSQASLAKLTPDDPNFAQRVELYMAGIELANGYSELIHPDEQKKRFAEENKIRRMRNQSVLPIPDKFLADLENMPESAGIALGLDRLVMIFCNASVIDEVVAFTPENL